MLSRFKTVQSEIEAIWEFVVMPAAKPTNSIHTSKYSVWSFLPLNLFYQLTKLANLYFVVVIIL